MATANPYDPKNRTISRTIYYSNQTGATVGSNISASPFPTAYGNYGPSVAETCTVDCSDSSFTYNVSPAVTATLNDVTNNEVAEVQIGTGHNNTAAETASALANVINNSSVGTWASADAVANGGTLTITHHTGAYKVKVLINGSATAAPLSGGTLANDHHTYAVTASGAVDRSFADGLVEGGSSYTVNVKQGV